MGAYGPGTMISPSSPQTMKRGDISLADWRQLEYGMLFGSRLGQLLAEAFTNGIWPTALKPFCVERATLRSLKQAFS